MAQQTPQEQPPADALFRFIAYGDTRSQDDIHQEIVNDVMKYHPALVLQTGDLVSNGKNANQWKKFDEITAELRKKILFYPVRGNHDDKGEEGYEGRVQQPFRPGGNKLFYAFDKGKVRFIAIDSEEADSLKVGQNQYKWLVSELEDAKAKHLIAIPFFHRAIFSIGVHGSDKSLRALLHPLFVQNGVKLAFQGHDHLYYHTVRDGITYIVTGGGGAPLYDFDHIEEKQANDTYVKDYHFCICDVYPKKITVTVLRKSLKEVEPPFSIPLP